MQCTALRTVLMQNTAFNREGDDQVDEQAERDVVGHGDNELNN